MAIKISLSFFELKVATFLESGFILRHSSAVTAEKEEMDVIATFLPQQMSAEELRAEVSAIITQLGATGMKDMGKVMGTATKQLAGKTDGDKIAAIVKEILGAS